MQLRNQQFVAVSRRLGKSSGWILTRHLLPHLVPQFLVGLILMFPHAILHEASISFFGLRPASGAAGHRHHSLGEHEILVRRYVVAGGVPGLLLVAVVLLMDRLGENLRVILDPYSAQE